MNKIRKLPVLVAAKPRKTVGAGKCRSEGAVAATSPFAVDLGKRLVSVRGRATLRDFARSLDIHKNTLIRYERGERLPDAWLITQLREIHGVNPLWLLSGVGEPRGAIVPAFDPRAHAVPPMSAALLSLTLQAVDLEAAARGLSLTGEQKADVALTVYGLVNTAVKGDDVDQLARLTPVDIRGAVSLVINLKGLRSPPDRG